MIVRGLFKLSARLLSVLYRRRDATSLEFGIRILQTQLLYDKSRNLSLCLECAASPDRLLRFVAARCIGEWLSTDSAALPALLKLADDADSIVREGVGQGIAALWEQSTAVAIPVVEALLSHPSDRARATLALALIPLIRHSSAGANPYAPLLEKLLDDQGLAGNNVGQLVIARTLCADDREAAIALFRNAVGQKCRRYALDFAVKSIRKLYHSDAQLMDIIDAYEQTLPAGASGAGAGAGMSGPMMSGAMNFRTTAELAVSDRVIDRVVGQDHAVALIRRAAIQKRSVLMIGEPGTGKSLLGAALAELLPIEELEDVLVWPGVDERTTPTVETVPAGEGIRRRARARRRLHSLDTSVSFVFGVMLVSVFIVGLFYFMTRDNANYLWGAVAIAASLFVARRYVRGYERVSVPKVLLNNAGRNRAPFIEATGFHAGGLLGDVRHDPFQSGGVETAPHELIEPGAIHQAHRGVLFIDEVSTLGIESQQSLLTAFQEKKLPVTGRSPGSSGTMVRSQPIPCDFILVIAGNFADVEKMHPALRSRIRGYGYEIMMNTTMDDTPENQLKLARFIATEVRTDGRIPHFSREAVDAVIVEARVAAGEPNKLTTRLRELGGLVRAAGDLAVESGAAVVEPVHVHRARDVVKPLEEQLRASLSPQITPVARIVDAVASARGISSRKESQKG